MAFVINKSQQKSIFSSINTNPGPGTYSICYPQVEQKPAPFNSSTFKQSCFQINTSQSSLGPGQYLKTSLHQVFKSRTCTSSFKSKVTRFDYQNNHMEKDKNKNKPIAPQNSTTALNKFTHSLSQKYIALQNSNNPSLDNNHAQVSRFKTLQKQSCPHSHNNNNQSQHKKKLKKIHQQINNLRKQNHSRKINSIVNDDKKMVRILLSNPRNTQTFKSIYVGQDVQIKQVNGRGQYQIQKLSTCKNKSVIDWSKYKQKRFKRSKSLVDPIPGPGQYQVDVDTNQKTATGQRLSSSFSYNGVRSYMDTVIYKTNNQMKVKIMQSKGLKDKSPGPADYCPQKLLRESFYYGKQIMGVTSSQRFEMENSKVKIPGPGYYLNSEGKYKYSGIIKQLRHKIFGKNKSLIAKCSDKDFMALQQELKPVALKVADGSEIVACTLKQRCQSKAGSLSQQPRFQGNAKSRGPGPGQYISISSKERSWQQGSSIFKSNLQRDPFQMNKQGGVIPFYEMNRSDIGYKSQKKRQMIQSLKKVAIQKPAFDSNVERFTSQPHRNGGNPQKIIQQRQDQKQYQRDQIDYDSFKPYKQQKNYASVFCSTTKRQTFILKKNPGPGTYQEKDELNKKSFNSQYSQLKKKKELPSKLYQK